MIQISFLIWKWVYDRWKPNKNLRILDWFCTILTREVRFNWWDFKHNLIRSKAKYLCIKHCISVKHNCCKVVAHHTCMSITFKEVKGRSSCYLLLGASFAVSDDSFFSKHINSLHSCFLTCVFLKLIFFFFPFLYSVQLQRVVISVGKCC